VKRGKGQEKFSREGSERKGGTRCCSISATAAKNWEREKWGVLPGGEGRRPGSKKKLMEKKR